MPISLSMWISSWTITEEGNFGLIFRRSFNENLEFYPVTRRAWKRALGK
jgi:hypothetical protein